MKLSRVLVALLLFGISFGCVEAAVVVYLRALGEPFREKVLAGAEPATTNNRMELQACLEGLRALETLGIALGQLAHPLRAHPHVGDLVGEHVIDAPEDGEQVAVRGVVLGLERLPPRSGLALDQHRRRPADRALLVVEDSGEGIPPADQPHLFERFYRIDKAHSREDGGNGLGLSIVKRLVTSFGGLVSVSSKLGQGTTFTVGLPIAKDGAADQPLPALFTRMAAGPRSFSVSASAAAMESALFTSSLAAPVAFAEVEFRPKSVGILPVTAGIVILVRIAVEDQIIACAA